MYYKKFEEWNTAKKQIDGKPINKNFYVKPKEIWSTKIWINIGNEVDGKADFERPVLVLSKVWNLFWVLPMTTHWKTQNDFYHQITSYDFGKPSFVMLSHLKNIDKKRFTYPMWYVSDSEFAIIKKSLQKRIL